MAALNEAGVELKKIAQYFYPFTGMGRRFQKVCEFNGITVYDDYAHHPTEIKAALQAAASKFGKENVVAVFQPHRFTRLQSLWKEFLTAFENAGRVYDIHSRPSKMWAAAVYPYDVSIGFGDFKFKEVYKSVKVRMAGTVSYYSYSGSAWQNHLSKYFKHEGGINHAFTNNHLCPANKNVRKGIKKLRKKDIVYLEGYLIKYKFRGNDGRMEEGVSSTVRNDKESFRGNNGSGSCEQIYVTRVVSRHGDFR